MTVATVAVCDSSGLRRCDCSCVDCDYLREELLDLYREKAQVTLSVLHEDEKVRRIERIETRIRRLERML